jgi:hypothetical protein
MSILPRKSHEENPKPRARLYKPSANGKAEIEAAADKPRRLPVKPGGIPDELKRLEQWVCWDDRRRDEKWTKVPLDPKTGRAASSTDPATWGTFEVALDYYRRYGLAGVGFVFSPEDPYCGVDLDDCRDRGTKELQPWAREILDGLGSYTEVSPSGTGVKVFLRGKVPPGGFRKGAVEMYHQDRYFAVTGRRLAKYPARVLKRQRALTELHAQVFAAPEKQKPPSAVPSADGRAHTLSDDEIIRMAGEAKNGAKFKRLWAGDISGYDDDDSRAALALCGLLAFWTGPTPERIDRLFRKSGLMRPKWDERRGDTTWGAGVIRKALEGRTEFYDPDGDAQDDSGGAGKKESQATRLVAYAREALDLFHNPEGVAYATTKEKPHQTFPLRRKAAKQYLSHLFYRREKVAPGTDGIQTAINTLEGIAAYDAPEHPVAVRLAENQGKVYLDLGRPEWDAVEIGPDGWRVVDDPPVKFQRSRGMLALPVPTPGGSLDELRRLVNVARDEDWRLLVGWLVAALRHRGPYPVLCLHGEQGSCKSTTARLLRNLVDPNTAALRFEPKEARDLIIAATNSWAPVFDNLSHLPDWLSDGLCRIASGSGFATRELYTDSDEVLFEAARPIAVVGIEDLIRRGDLGDRALIVRLPAVKEADRRTEEDVLAEFETIRPGVLGALLDAVAAGLRNLPQIKPPPLPRMADFAQWTLACEPALPWEPGSFLRAYRENIRDANEVALGDSPLVAPLRKLLQERQGKKWVGTPTELLDELAKVAGEKATAGKDWPKGANVLTNRLRRLAPNLRKTGIHIECIHTGCRREITVEELGFGGRPKRTGKDR